jgi:hypothetical protein
MLNMRVSMESLRASLSQITPIPTGCISVLPENAMRDGDPVETHVHEEAHDPDDEDGDEDQDHDETT